MNSPTPSVSVLMPVYNSEEYLEDTMNSILGQSYRDFELIAVNDGSTDASMEILRKFEKADERVRVIDQDNTGIVGALNKGLENCRGDLIARMDSDDLMEPDRLSNQTKMMEMLPDVILLGGIAEVIDSDGETLYKTTGGRHKVTDLSVFPPKIAVAMHPLIMVRKPALDAIEGYRDFFPHAEDYDLYIRLAGEGRIYNPQKVMLKYRKHENAVSQKNLMVQERAAAHSELAAMAAFYSNEAREIEALDISKLLETCGISETLFERYVTFRIWRRMADDTQQNRQTLLKRIIFDVAKNMWRVPFNRFERQFTVRVMGSVVLSAIRSLS